MRVLLIDDYIDHLKNSMDGASTPGKEYCIGLIQFLDNATHINIPDEIVEKYKNGK